MCTGSDRSSYSDSCLRLQSVGLLPAGEIPPLPDRAPRYDDEVLGVEFFRTLLADVELDDLTLPRTYFAKSEVRAASFRGADLSESTMCWNDFIAVDFRSASLQHADLRASSFERVTFDRADLTGADLRRSTFATCSWTGAVLTGARISRVVAQDLPLSEEQRGQLDLQETEGPEPDGG